MTEKLLWSIVRFVPTIKFVTLTQCAVEKTDEQGRHRIVVWLGAREAQVGALVKRDEDTGWTVTARWTSASTEHNHPHPCLSSEWQRDLA